MRFRILILLLILFSGLDVSAYSEAKEPGMHAGACRSSWAMLLPEASAGQQLSEDKPYYEPVFCRFGNARNPAATARENDFGTAFLPFTATLQYSRIIFRVFASFLSCTENVIYFKRCLLYPKHSFW